MAFPNTFKDEQQEVLAYMVVEKQIPLERLQDAVNNCIMTCRGFPSVADILSFDRDIRMYTYNEVCAMWQKSEAVQDDFEKVRYDKKTYWILKTDIAKHNINIDKLKKYLQDE